MNIPQLSIRTTLLAIIILLNSLIGVFVGTGVHASWTSFKAARTLTRGSANVNLLYRTSKLLSLERAASLSAIYVDADTAETLRQDIAADRREADEDLRLALAGIAEPPPGAEIAALVSAAGEKVAALRALRAALDDTLDRPPPQRDRALPDRIFAASTALIMTLRDLILVYDRPLRVIDPVVGQQMMFKYFVWEVTEYAGREYAVIGRLIAESKPNTPEIQQDLFTWRSLIRHGWQTAGQFMAGSGLDRELKSYMDEAETHYFLSFDQTKEVFYTPESLAPGDTYPLGIGMWLELSSQAVDSLLALKEAALHETQGYVDRMERRARRQIVLNMIVLLCAAAVSLYCLGIIVWRVIRPVNAMVDALYKAAQGQPYDALPAAHRHDEIGKLASVLEAFQENALRIRQSNEELERYAYITAHDLKSPLRAIDNLSQWIEEDLGQALTGKTREHMDTLRQRVRRMEKLLSDTLQYSRIDKQVSPANTDVINLKVLVEEAVSLAAPPPGFTIMIGEGFSAIQHPRLPLQQVFYNLINNAIKHHEQETGRIEITLEEEEGAYIFSVRDDGPGIPRQYHEKVFEMFQTLKPRDQREGSGMGLAIIRKILTTCGGTITLESEPGRGCLFRVTWPKPGREKKNVRQYLV